MTSDRLTNLQAVATVTRDARTDLLTINQEFSASIVLARCTTTPAGRLRWNIRLDTILHPDITIVVRMTSNNHTILDYYLIPTNDLFTSLAARARIPEAA